MIYCLRPYAPRYLYPPGDVAQAATLVGALASDVNLRRKAGRAARNEVAAWGWSAATKFLRERQYLRAIKVHLSRRRRAAARLTVS